MQILDFTIPRHIHLTNTKQTLLRHVEVLEENHDGPRWWLRLQQPVNELPAAQNSDIPCLDRVLYQDTSGDHSALLPYYCESPQQLQRALDINSCERTRTYSASVHSQEYEYQGEQSCFDG